MSSRESGLCGSIAVPLPPQTLEQRVYVDARKPIVGPLDRLTAQGSGVTRIRRVEQSDRNQPAGIGNVGQAGVVAHELPA